MNKHTLSADARTITGRKVSQLRNQFKIPANIFGKHLTSTSVSVGIDAFTKVFHEAGETGIIELKVGTDLRPVLVKNVQLHPVTGYVLHVDFYQVDLKEKVSANVPVKISGSASAVDAKLGVLLELLHELEVEALPMDLPEFILIDVTKLAAVGDAIKISDLKLPVGVEVKTDKELEVVKIDSLVSKEAEEQAKADEASAAEAAATKEAASATPAAGTPSTPAASAATGAKAPSKKE
jgi:large subunit ribosomal protein L25